MSLVGTQRVINNLGQAIPTPVLWPNPDVVRRPHIQPVPSQDGVIFEYSDDLLLRQQYFDLREKCYREDLGLKSFSGRGEEYDLSEHVLIARKGNKVVAGARIIPSLPWDRHHLALEEDGFEMEEVFPDMRLANRKYCEFSRVIIDKDYRGGDLFRQMGVYLFGKAKQLGYSYLFTVATQKQSRINKITMKKLGYDYHITDIQAPAKPIYGGLEMWLGWCQLKNKG